MPEALANPTDTAICRLLAAGPVPTVVVATRLGVPERTVRHRLYRLRQAGAVVTGADGLHRLAVPASAAPVSGPLPDLAVPPSAAPIAVPLPDRAAAGLSAPVSGPLRDLAVPALAPDFPASDGLSPRHGGHSPTLTVLAVVALGIAVAGGLAVMVHIRHMPPPPPPPTGFGDAGNAWGWMPGPTW